MYEPKEIVNMLASIAFFIYFYSLIRKGKCNRIPEIWLYGIFLITISNIATVVEGFYWASVFNFIEHFSFTIACLFFLKGAILIKPEEK
jgi:hypothetical protein